LLINSTINDGSTAVTVNSGGTLSGSGTLSRPVTLNSGGRLSPGSAAAAGVLRTNSVAAASGSVFAFDLNAPYATAGTDYDQVNVTGSVSLGGATLNLVGGAGTPAPGTVVRLINNDGTDPVSGTF